MNLGMCHACGQEQDEDDLLYCGGCYRDAYDEGYEHGIEMMQPDPPPREMTPKEHAAFMQGVTAYCQWVVDEVTKGEWLCPMKLMEKSRGSRQSPIASSS